MTAPDIATPEDHLLKEIKPHLGRADGVAAFAGLLFADSSDGIDRWSPERLAELAREGFAFLQRKPRRAHKIHWQTRSLDRSGPLTVVEILNDDMPFLVDSIASELQARGLSPRLILHPILKVRRSEAGELQGLVGPGDSNWSELGQESYILILLDPLAAADADELTAALSTVLDDVRAAVTDWHAMMARLDQAIDGLEKRPPRIPPEMLSESIAFCRWLRDGQLTFLGCRDYRLETSAEAGELVAVPSTSLGVLRDSALHVLRRADGGLAMTPEIRSQFLAPSPLIISKSSIMSRVHRRADMDFIGLKLYGSNGEPVGQLRIVGLLTSQAYTQSPEQIPFLRHKVATVIARSGFAPGSHAAKAFANVLATFPRDELFQIGEDRLLSWVRGIVDLELRPRVRLFARPDRFGRFVSVLVYAPRERFSTVVRERISTLLAGAYNGEVTDFTPYFPEGPLVRIHFVIGLKEGPRPEVDETALEMQIAAATRTWDDRLADELRAAGGDIARLAPKYQRAFPAGYEEMFPPARALEDIGRIERLSADRPMAIDLREAPFGGARRVSATIYRLDRPVPLSERVPVLENLGFSVIDERSYRVMPRFAEGPREVSLHDMALETTDGAPTDLETHGTRIEACFLAVCRGEAENDSFNRLVIKAGADWREVAVLRAYAAYMRQARSPFGLRYIADTMSRHAGVARDLVELFHTRFDPGRDWSDEQRATTAERIRGRIEGALAAVPSLDEDRILRQYLSLVLATVRTNFFQSDRGEQPPSTIAFKLDSHKVDLPEPRPFREIWVYSPRVEGVHLRFAPVARGGLRWSDRAQDFRTEVLGLAKAQQVKNTVIVPAGAKGGFLPKQLPRGGERDAIMSEGIAAYQLFVSTMLDVTDNIVAGHVVPPKRVLRHDGDDPYLVVAADKGTATFSDIANDISDAHNFWLGDAFASGGSHGYDHKRMAITSRGAWECVKRHFREMDIDIQTMPFRVTGVGDMSGDVFGNGMLMSPVIRLVAAFDHRDIFIDPEPDPEVGFAERRRLYDKPRSSWQDYDRATISEGGGVFSRSLKSVPISSAMRRLLAIEAEALTPAELIRAVLRCETDLLWFGGIGTYIKAAAESDEAVGDRANDNVRIVAGEVRAKVIGEGANLGVTQRGRIEYASRGGRINTDFIDNSAGVNCSDQEVNIKIALRPAVGSGALNGGERDRLLVSMTDDVAAACLANNYQQSLALSLAERRSADALDELERLIEALESRDLIDRKLEALPSREEMAQRQVAGAGLTRPELAVLLSFAKIALTADLIHSRAPDDPGTEPLLVNYFPPALRERFRGEIESHRLRREIIVTALTNAMINRGGPAMAVRLADETGREPADVALAFLAADEIFGISALWHDIGLLDGRIGGSEQLDLYARVSHFHMEQTESLLRHGLDEGVGQTVAVHRASVATLAPMLASLATRRQLEAEGERRRELEAAGAPHAFAARIAGLDLLSHAPAITWLAAETGQDLSTAARAALAAADYLRLDELKTKAGRLSARDYYDQLAASGALHALEAARRTLAVAALGSRPGGDFDFAAWERGSGRRLARAKALLDDIAQSAEVTVSRLTVAASQLRDLADR